MVKNFIICSISLFLLSISVVAFSSDAASDSCEDILVNGVIAGHLDRDIVITPDRVMFKLLWVLNGVDIGNLFYIIRDDFSAYISWSETKKDYRMMGISKKLFQQMLLDNPEIVEITSTLVDDNLSIADSVKTKDCYQAVVSTPAYKVRKSIGFGRIVHCDYLPGAFLHFVVRRHNAHE